MERRKLWQNLYGCYTDESGKERDGHLVRAQTVIGQLGNAFTFDPLPRGLPTMARLMNQSLGRFVDSFSDAERKGFLNIPVPRRAKKERPVATLEFKHLTPDFLTTYEQLMQHYGKVPQTKPKPATGASLTTAGFYLGRVRVMVNNAIRDGLLPITAYPFGKGCYVIPAGANVKKAFSKETITLIKEYQPMPGTMEQRSHDLWLFSYCCNGMNFADICQLTWANVALKESRLNFIRQKTTLSKKQNQSSIVVHLRPETVAIIERWGTTERRANAYVFPFMAADMTDRQKKQAVHPTVKTTNRWMSKIAESLSIKGNVNTYSCMHSFAITSFKSNAPLAFTGYS